MKRNLSAYPPANNHSSALASSKQVLRSAMPYTLPFCLAAALTLSLPAARAAETVVPITPPGATDIDQAFLPPAPGLYGGFAMLPYSQNTHVYDSSGRPAPPSQNLKLALDIYVPVLLYVYPFQIMGGQVASSWVQPVQHLDYSIGGGAVTGNQFGLGDAFTDVFFWTKNIGMFGATPGKLPLSYGLSVAVGLAAVVPVGGYNRQNPLNLGGNTWALDPNIAFTYNSGASFLGDNTQVSTRLFYGVPFENSATHYTSGNIFDIDWSVTEQWGSWRLGIAGYFQTQTTDDTQASGIPLPNGNKFTNAAIGPVIEYFIPNMNMYVKAKYQYTFVHDNFVDQQFVVLSTGFKF